jgi:glyoxylase-like metal-dependent hydrolase (beta-lactamase superfamily II)
MSVQLWAIEGNRQWLDGGAMFGNAPRVVWEKWLTPDEQGRIPLACRALLAKIDDKIILCETGIGAFFEPKMAERYGVENPNEHCLLSHLMRLGFNPDQIDFVILSHLHFDHAGGLLPSYTEAEAGQRDLLFQNAKYVVGKEAWQRALNPHPRDRASFIPGLTDKLVNSGRLIVVEGTEHPQVCPNHIRFFYSHGHTPGQMLTQIKGTEKSVIFAGDLIPGQAWVHVPITMGYDRFPEQLIDEKTQLYQKIANDDWWVFFTHDPNVIMGQIGRDTKGRFQTHNTQTNVTSHTL